MIPRKNLEVIREILSPLRKSQRKVVTSVVQAIAWMDRAASIPIAIFLSQATGSQGIVGRKPER